VQAKKPNFFLSRVVLAFVCHVHFLSLIYILIQIQGMSNSDWLNSYAGGNVDGSRVVGGLVGYDSGNGSTSSSKGVYVCA